MKRFLWYELYRKGSCFKIPTSWWINYKTHLILPWLIKKTPTSLLWVQRSMLILLPSLSGRSDPLFWFFQADAYISENQNNSKEKYQNR